MKFELNEFEAKKAKEFIKKHSHRDINKGTIGGHITYHFTPTYIGDAIEIECNICNTVENITDYDSW